MKSKESVKDCAQEIRSEWSKIKGIEDAGKHSKKKELRKGVAQLPEPEGGRISSRGKAPNTGLHGSALQEQRGGLPLERVYWEKVSDFLEEK